MAEPTKTTTSPPPDPSTKPPPSPPKTTSFSWGTLEDLLLACAVNRHGTTAWDSVSHELNHRRTTSVFTPSLCHGKYLDLKRRFSAVDGGDDGGGDDIAAVRVDELRRLRVAELKRDLHRYDISIVSLQLKVKRLKEERERSERDENEKETNKNEGQKTDLNQPDPLKTIPPGSIRRNDDSSNESNSTDSEPEPVKLESNGEIKPDRLVDSCNGSSNSKESGPGVEVDVEERVDSGELGESGAESRGEGVKESSDVQSTASLRKRAKERSVVLGNSSGDDNRSVGSKFSSGGSGRGDKVVCNEESKGLAGFLDLVRTSKCGPVFDSPLEGQPSQDTLRYKSIIREHIDLKIIQKRVEEGRYTNCNTMFNRDFMLLVNNALVFFPKRSSEHKCATELRQLVTQHLQAHLNSKSCSPPKPEVDQPDHPDLKPKLTITGPVIACRKRSSIAGKLSSSEAENKESLSATAKPATVELLKKEGEKSLSTSFNAVTKKRTRDQSSGSRNPTSKNPSNRPSPIQKPSPRNISSKGETSEAKKPSSGNSSSRSKQGSRPNNDLLLDVLDSAVKRRIIGNGSSSGKNTSDRSDRNKDPVRGGSRNGANKKPSMEKGKGREERGSPRNKNTTRPPKKTTPAKRGRDSGRDSEVPAKKRSRR